MGGLPRLGVVPPFVPVLVLAAMGMLVSEALKLLERRLARWK